MKSVLLVLGAALLGSATLSACASYGPHGGRAPSGYYDAAGYNAYYDDSYGPFYDGYWEGENFMFSRGQCTASTAISTPRRRRTRRRPPMPRRPPPRVAASARTRRSSSG
jgi:hypothetical protein